MASFIKTITDIFNNKIYPKTKVNAVYDDNNNRLDTILASKQDTNSNFVYKGTGSATPSIDDPELRQSDISTTQSTSDITVPSSSLVKTMNDNLGNPSSASSVTGADAFSKISTLNSNLTVVQNNVACIKFYPESDSKTIPSWSPYVAGFVIGFMQNVGSFIGIISGTTYTHLGGSDVSSYLSLTISGTNLILTSTYRCQFTMVGVF
jgi:hypothetical protein